jgi:glycosyltransferase involved in cell wall biosynthesis
MTPYHPLVSIITPSLNQGRFIATTLESIANQSSPNLEHIIIDGGSTDESIAIISEYAKAHPGRVTWISEPDRGQADAINKGMRRASGSIIAYLNSDDTYEPETVARVVTFFRDNPDIALVHGMGLHIGPEGHPLDAYPSHPCDHIALAENCPICQPTAFWQRNVIDTIGFFNPNLRFTMDYDYWIRISARLRIGFIPKHLANTRLHSDAKTVSLRHPIHREIVTMVKSHYGRVSDHWIFSYAHSFPMIHRLRQGNVFMFSAYIVAFVCTSAWLFLRYNHYIPLRTITLFFKTLAGHPTRTV